MGWQQEARLGPVVLTMVGSQDMRKEVLLDVGGRRDDLETTQGTVHGRPSRGSRVGRAYR